MNRRALIITVFLVMKWIVIAQAVRVDPFSLPRRHARKSLNHPKLKGIVRQGQRCGALLAQGQKAKIVFAGDAFAHYTVVRVDQQNVCLTQGSQQITLTLDEKEN